jgi:hypothetical protein
MISPSAEQQIRLDEIRTRLRRYRDGGWTMKPEPDSPAWEGFVPAARYLYTHAPGDLDYLLTLLGSLSQELERIRTENQELLARSVGPDVDRDFSIHAPTDGGKS